MDEDLKQYLHEMEQRIGARIDAYEQRLIERMRDMQTELLKGYLPAQELANTRDSVLEARQLGVETRVNSVEKRLWEIEKKILLNPPAA
jgi:hypothetical protein